MSKHRLFQHHLSTKQRLFINLLSLIEVIGMLPVTLHVINTTYSILDGLYVFLGVSFIYLSIVLVCLWFYDKKFINKKERVKNG